MPRSVQGRGTPDRSIRVWARPAEDQPPSRRLDQRCGSGGRRPLQRCRRLPATTSRTSGWRRIRNRRISRVERPPGRSECLCSKRSRPLSQPAWCWHLSLPVGDPLTSVLTDRPAAAVDANTDTAQRRGALDHFRRYSRERLSCAYARENVTNTYVYWAICSSPSLLGLEPEAHGSYYAGRHAPGRRPKPSHRAVHHGVPMLATWPMDRSSWQSNGLGAAWADFSIGRRSTAAFAYSRVLDTHVCHQQVPSVGRRPDNRRGPPLGPVGCPRAYGARHPHLAPRSGDEAATTKGRCTTRLRLIASRVG